MVTYAEMGVAIPHEKKFADNIESSTLESFHDGYVFRVDYAPGTPDAVLQNDIVTYLEEYRLQVQKSRYEMLYTKDSNGELALRSSDNGESMLAIGRNAIADREKNGKPVRKETADLLGMQKVESFMTEADDGDTILWASPPDPSVGYEYGFFYIGQVETLGGQEKKIKMSAVRLDNKPTLSQFNTALSLVAQKKIVFDTVNEFISNPHLLKRKVAESELDFILKGTFSFERDHHEEQKKQAVFARLQPYINTFKQLVREGAPQNILRKMVFALENYALQLNAEEEERGQRGEQVIFTDYQTPSLSADRFVDRFAFVPPPVVGSCDAGSSTTGPNILGYASIFSSGSRSPLPGGSEQKTWTYTKGDCILCKETAVDVGPCRICRSCERKFDK